MCNFQGDTSYRVGGSFSQFYQPSSSTNIFLSSDFVDYLMVISSTKWNLSKLLTLNKKKKIIIFLYTPWVHSIQFESDHFKGALFTDNKISYNQCSGSGNSHPIPPSSLPSWHKAQSTHTHTRAHTIKHHLWLTFSGLSQWNLMHKSIFIKSKLTSGPTPSPFSRVLPSHTDAILFR